MVLSRCDIVNVLSNGCQVPMGSSCLNLANSVIMQQQPEPKTNKRIHFISTETSMMNGRAASADDLNLSDMAQVKVNTYSTACRIQFGRRWSRFMANTIDRYNVWKCCCRHGCHHRMPRSIWLRALVSCFIYHIYLSSDPNTTYIHSLLFIFF